MLAVPEIQFTLSFYIKKIVNWTNFQKRTYIFVSCVGKLKINLTIIRYSSKIINKY